MSSQLPILPNTPPAPSLKNAGGDPSFVKGKYCFISLGCPKNLVDSERMLGLLQLDGYKLVNTPEEADFAVVNTCGFIEAARRFARRDCFWVPGGATAGITTR